jgi:transcription elongation GreA/GreB family factor
MPLTELLELAKTGKGEAFETRCLELLESGMLTLAQLIGPFEQFERDGRAERLVTLTQMVFETLAPTTDPAAALALARVALIAAPQNEELRKLTVELYRQVYGQEPNLQAVLESSGLITGRAVRTALRVLDLCLALQPGDLLISRMDDRVVEITDLDRARGLFTLRREGRVTTLPAAEVSREYDRIARDDFRALRQAPPEQLAKLIADDPVAVVIGIIHAHGEHIDADLLRQELVPRYIEQQAWSTWWSRAKRLLKRSPHVVVEGRAPILLTYCAAGHTVEDETWAAFAGHNEPEDWLGTAEGYLREKAARKEPPDAVLLQRLHDHIANCITAVRARRPAEALACALVLGRLGEKGVPTTADARELAVTMLRETADPVLLLKGVSHEGLRERGLELLKAAHPETWVDMILGWLSTAPAVLLDKLATAAVDAGRVEDVQCFVDLGLADPAGHPELFFWLWKTPTRAQALRLPADAELFRQILDMLSALGRTVTAEPEVVKEFRHRMKAALGLRDYAKVRQVFQACSESSAITMRRQLNRLEGLGDNAPTKMLDILRDVHPLLWVVRSKQVAPWQEKDYIWSTPEGANRRTAERDEILNVKMPQNAKRIGEAASHGDLSENSEYKFALEERDLLRARLATINDELSRTRVLSAHDVPADIVGIGSRVTLRTVADGTEKVMTFLGAFDSDVDHGIYSYVAPTAQKLMGKSIGEHVTFLVDGQECEFEIVALANALDHGSKGTGVPGVYL